MNHTLYRFFDAGGVLLYIGITGDVRTRWSLHSKTKDEWRRVATIKVQHYDSRDELVEAERSAIKAEHPLWNKQHNEQIRSVAEVRTLLDAGEWLAAEDVAVLFGTTKKVSSDWLRRGTKVLPHLPPVTRKTDSRVEVCPVWVNAVLLECRKIRSCDYPDGIPGQLVDLPHWSQATATAA